MQYSKEQMNRLTEGPLTRSMLVFTVPFLLSSLLQMLYGTVDTLVIGNFGSTAGVSAVAVGAQTLSLVTYLLMGLSGGSTVLLGQFIGSRDHKSAAEVVGDTVVVFTALSFLLMGVMLCIYPVILQLLNTPEAAMPEARRYMSICCFGIPLIAGYNTVCALLRAIGDSKSPLLFVGVACVVNVAGDLLLTGVLGMGAAGVAIATVAAQGVSFLFSLFFTMKKGLGFPFAKKDIRYSGSMTARIAKIGIPMGVQSILINLSFMFITAIINSMGLTASAAMGIGDKIVNFAFMPQSAFSSSLAVVVAQNIGAGKPERAMKAMKTAAMICVSIELVFMAVCQLQPGFFPSLFSRDSEVVRMAGFYMRVYSFDALLTAVTFCCAGYLNGRGLTTFNMIQNLATTFLIRVPGTWFFSVLPNPTMYKVAIAAPLSSLVSLVLLFFYIRHILKKGISAV